MDYSKIAKDVIKYVGGPENISSVMHCATRLRLKLKDEKFTVLPINQNFVIGPSMFHGEHSLMLFGIRFPKTLIY